LKKKKITKVDESNKKQKNEIYLNVQKGEQIGAGSFGKVFKGLWGVTTVALKSLTSSESIKEFESEANILRALRHPKVVSFLGIGITPSGEEFLCTEYLACGSLESVLREKKIETSNKLTLGMDICAGMLYLSEHNIIHRDLAARNILCYLEGDTYTAKVGDFGLSRIIKDYYYDSSSRIFPIKHTAPEAIKYQRYSLESDVWSIGIVLWEVFSDGEIPYAEMTNSETLQKVVAGYRLGKPPNCSDDIFKIMLDCWHHDPHNRPHWKVLYSRLQSCCSTLHLNKSADLMGYLDQ